MTPARSPRRSRTVVLAAFAAIVIVPRLVRMCWPQIWIEDESYLTGALAVARGLRPYRDFPLPHLPLLETVAATVFRIAGASIRTAEALTQVAAAAGTALVFAVGAVLGGDAAALAAALIFSTSPLLFRYHVFEREVFAVVPVLAAVLIVARDDEAIGRRRTGVATGLLLGIALSIKLTAIAAVIGLAAHLVAARRGKLALIVVATALAFAGGLAALLFAAFGSDFAAQVVVFRLLHATFPSLGVKLDEMRLSLDIAFALGVAGVIYLVMSRFRKVAPVASGSGRTRRAGFSRTNDIVLYQLAAGFIVLVLLNPTYWAHTGIELLPWLSLSGGVLIANLAKDGRARGCAAVAVALVLFVSPVRNLNWEAGDGSPFGFGYRDRAEIDKAAAIVRTHAAPQEPVATPPIIAFQANRRELVPYAELAGEMQELVAAIGREGYRRALSDPALGRGTFWESVEDSARLIAPKLADAVRRRQVAVVINDSPDDLMPVQLVDLAPEDLRASGYSMEAVTAHYEFWVRR